MHRAPRTVRWQKFLQTFKSFHGDFFLSVTPMNKAAESLLSLDPFI